MIQIWQSGSVLNSSNNTLTAGPETNWERQWVCEGEIVVFPWHSMEYNIVAGRCLANPGRRLPTYPVHVQNEMICVTL